MHGEHGAVPKTVGGKSRPPDPCGQHLPAGGLRRNGLGSVRAEHTQQLTAAGQSPVKGGGKGGEHFGRDNPEIS